MSRLRYIACRQSGLDEDRHVVIAESPRDAALTYAQRHLDMDVGEYDVWVCPEHVLNEAGGNPSHSDATVVVTVRAVRVWRAW